MKYDKLPENHHVLRFAGSNRLQKDGSGNVVALAPAAFQLRPEDDGELSVTWMELLATAGSPRGHDAVRAYRASMTKPLGAKSAFGVAQVREITSIFRGAGKRVRILHDPTPKNAAHSVVHGHPHEDSEMMELLASSIFCEILLNSAVP